MAAALVTVALAVAVAAVVAAWARWCCAAAA